MKKFLAIGFWMALLTGLWGQAVQDTVSIGAGYSNQAWYGLSSGDRNSAAKTGWDLAFELSPQGSSILFNTVAGATLWCYPNSDTSGWASLDTTGISGWTARWNSDTSWSLGALSNYLNPSDPFDLGWGVYSTITHYVTGDSLYVVKLANGDYKKLWIRSLATGVYNFTHADLNGSNTIDRPLTKSDYTGKNFVYYEFESNTIQNREPLSADWDLFFTQYTAFIPMPYTVAGVLVNKGLEVAKVGGVADVNAYSDYSAATFGTAMNGIGYDWKAFAGSWVIEDSLLYLVRKPNGEVWKLVFTGFGGSASGDFHFTKQLLNATGAEEALATPTTAITAYPNPSQGAITLSYALNRPAQSASITVSDLSGRQVHRSLAPTAVGLQTVALDLGLGSGFYLLDLEVDGAHHALKWIVE